MKPAFICGDCGAIVDRDKTGDRCKWDTSDGGDPPCLCAFEARQEEQRVRRAQRVFWLCMFGAMVALAALHRWLS